MAEKIFKNAASKLLAQHALKSEEKKRMDISSGAIPIVTPALAVKLEMPDKNSERFDSMRANPAPGSIPVSAPLTVPLKEPVPTNVTQSNMISSLIKYIIILLCALGGWAVMAFIGPQTSLGTGGNIALGLGGGAVLGLLLTVDLKN